MTVYIIIALLYVLPIILGLRIRVSKRMCILDTVPLIIPVVNWMWAPFIYLSEDYKHGDTILNKILDHWGISIETEGEISE